MTSKRRENINLVSFICLSFLNIDLELNIITSWSLTDLSNRTRDFSLALVSFSSYSAALNTRSTEKHFCK